MGSVRRRMWLCGKDADVSLDDFVRASGAVMGLARESFGVGEVGVSGGAAALDVPPSPVHASGRAAENAARESRRVTAHVSALADRDEVADRQLAEAFGAADIGRGRMDSVIAAAVADVAALGWTTNTAAGQRALVAAIRRRLEDTKATLGEHDADAQTRAADANVTASGYSGVSAPNRGGLAPLMSGMPVMPAGMGGGAPMGGMSSLPVAPLGGLMSLFGQQPDSRAVVAGSVAGREGMLDDGGSPAAAIGLHEVRYDREAFAKGPEAYRGYIAKALDVMGITDPVRRVNWARGFMTALPRESGFNPLAVNVSDANAHGALMPDGAPAGSSRGGAQMVPGTFAAFHQPGTSTNIYDPVANLCAAMNYLMHRYHVARDGSNMSAVSQFDPHHTVEGY